METYTEYLKYRLYEKLFHMASPQEAMESMEFEFSSSLNELVAAADQAIMHYQHYNTTIH